MAVARLALARLSCFCFVSCCCCCPEVGYVGTIGMDYAVFYVPANTV